MLYSEKITATMMSFQEIFIKRFQNPNFVFPTGSFMFKVNNKSSRIRCEICSKLATKTPERRHWCRSGVFIVILNIFQTLFFYVFIVNFEQVNAGWVVSNS